jgi:hypothetical protein
MIMVIVMEAAAEVAMKIVKLLVVLKAGFQMVGVILQII